MDQKLITADDLLDIGISEPGMQDKFLRISNGLITKGKMSKEEVMQGFLELIHQPKKYTKTKGKFYNLATYVAEQNSSGAKIELSEYGKSQLALLIKDGQLKEEKKLNEQGTGAFNLNVEPAKYTVYGKEEIEEGAYKQMDVAMRLPIAVAGSLMPDTHQGYGLPIGGVLATRPDTIIPYAVGVDIACRMCMSIFDISPGTLNSKNNPYKKLLLDHTYFGIGSSTRKKFNDDLFDKPVWNEIKIIRDLKSKAHDQLGTSGTGNHFVEWGILEVTANDALLGINEGTYLALLSHSGSRGFGGNIAGHYSKIAMQKTILPQEAKHLAWLNLNSEEGMEYWVAMNLAGEYASANHHEIHNKIAKALGSTPLKRIENHHNFAWKETLADGRAVMVHRKGATPASVEELGIIPGSMTQPGFLVRGKGNPASIQSASHGAGRRMSRTKAFENITPNQFKKAIEEAGIELIGSDLDEAPMVYKDIHKVISNQHELVSVLAKFTPKIVRMAAGKERAED